MSDTEKKPAPAARKTAVKETAQKRGTMVYVGPDIVGAKQYTVYDNGLPDVLKEKINRHPVFHELIIPVEKLVQVNTELEKEGSAFNILFQKAMKIKEEG